MYWLEDLLALVNVTPPTRLLISRAASLIAILIPVPIILAFMKWQRPRQSIIPPYRERVLILGGSSGVGKELALQYARRGCRRLAIVGRRKEELELVAKECEEERKKGEEWEMSDEAPGYEKMKSYILPIKADCSNANDILKIRQECKEKFDGIDTIHICFGVSALRPLLGIAGIDPVRPMKRAELLSNSSSSSSSKSNKSQIEADLDGILNVQEATRKINEINVTGTSMILTAFLPMLQITSTSPSIHLLSSLITIISAPTRPLYGCSKSGQLSLFQSVAIEASVQSKKSKKEKQSPIRNHVRFYASVPATIRSEFRNSAVDGSPDDIPTFDSSWNVKPGKKSDILLPEQVASHVILAIDQFVEGIDEISTKYWLARRLYPFFPGLFKQLACKKYSYI